MRNKYDSKLKYRYRYIVGIIVLIMCMCLYFIFFDKKGLLEEEAKNIISDIDKGYDVILADNNYTIGDKSYYVLYSNIRSNTRYTDKFNIDSKVYYRIDASYYKLGNEEIWQARYCIDKESKEVYIEFKNNIRYLVSYSDYNANINYALSIINKYNNVKNPHIEVNVEGNIYTIHLYEIIENEDESHIATIGWYTLNTKTMEVKNMITEETLNM